jgi:multiple sugar transport system substrate-binding protein
MKKPQSGPRSRLFKAISAGSIIALALTGCAAASTDTPTDDAAGEYTGPAVELSYWNGFTGGDGPFMQQMVETFNAEHENITVVSNTIPWGDFYSTLPAAITAGEGPDVGVMHLDQLATFAARGAITPVDDVASAIGLSAADFTPEIWSATEYKGARYGIPLDVHSIAMYYNTEHFEKAGITSVPTDKASFEAALVALQKAGYATPFWMPNRWPSHLMNLSLNWQFGGSAWGSDGTTAEFASASGVSALEWQRSMVDKKFSTPEVAPDGQYIAFKNGETSITWDGIWQINDLQASGMTWAMAPIPTIGSQPAFWANSHNFFLPKTPNADGNKVAAAKVFIAWMSEQSGTWAGSGMIPARLSVRDSGVLNNLPQKSIADAIANMRFLPSVPGIGGVQGETFEVAVSEGVLGTKDIKTALTEAQKNANLRLEENRAAYGG